MKQDKDYGWFFVLQDPLRNLLTDATFLED